MIKRYCDQCGDELVKRNTRLIREDTRLLGKIDCLSFEIITGKDATWNDGDFCQYCIADAIALLVGKKPGRPMKAKQ
jgi:hypothetical protein